MKVEERAAGSDFGTLLRRYRLAADLSQEALAERARMSSDGISALERGHRRTPQRETVALLAGALELSEEQRLELEAAAARRPIVRRGASVTVGPWADVTATNLPLSLSSFIGREEELAEIATLLRQHRMVTLTGAGGVGKTQTALRAASTLSAEVTVRFIGLAPMSDPNLLVPAIASALGVQDVPVRTLLETVTAYLRSRTMFLVLDNCEHVIVEVGNVATVLLSSCPCLRILATSREPMKAAGEYAYRLPSLSIASAVELFSDRARAVDHQFALTDETAPIAAEICRRLDGIPLAIELAAARTHLLPVRVIAEKLDDRFRILAGGERTAMPRQQTMRATIEWSYDLLSKEEQRFFRRVAIFANSWTFEASEVVCSDERLDTCDVLDLTSSLVQKSLMVSEVHGTPRYRLLESMRALALEKVVQSGERETLARRHARWAADLGDRAYNIARTAPFSRWLTEFEPDFGNMRSAIGWALGHNEIAVAARILVAFARGYRDHREVNDTRGWLHTVLDEIDAAAHPALAASAWGALSHVALGPGKIAAAQRTYELGKLCNDPPITVQGLLDLATGLQQVGRPLEAQSFVDQAMMLFEKHDLTRFYPFHFRVLSCKASSAMYCGRFDEARCAFEEGFALATEHDDEVSVAALRCDLAELEFQIGNVARALELVKAVEAASHGLPSFHVAYGLANAAAYQIALGDIADARIAATEALRLSRGAFSFQTLSAIQHLAAIAACGDGPRRAARLRGYVDAQLHSEGIEREPTEQYTYEILLSTLRKKLTDAEIAAFAAEGAEMTEEVAVTEALGAR